MTLHTDLSDGIGRITLARPDRRNALTRAMLDQIASVTNAWSGTARVILLTAEGPVFSAGADLEEVAAGLWRDTPMTALCRHLSDQPAPLICGLAGPVHGAAVELVAACDLRLGTSETRLAIPAARLGLHYDAEGMARLAATLGDALARRLLVFAEPLEATTLQAAGFLAETVPADTLAARLTARAEATAALAPLAVQSMRQTLTELATGTHDPATGATRVAAGFASADHAEALAARKEKRAPIFRGH